MRRRLGSVRAVTTRSTVELYASALPSTRLIAERVSGFIRCALVFNAVRLSSARRGRPPLFVSLSNRGNGARVCVAGDLRGVTSVSLVHGAGRCSPAGSRAMRFSWMFAATVLLALLVTEARCKRKFDGDFEFAEEVSPLLTYLLAALTTFLLLPLSRNHHHHHHHHHWLTCHVVFCCIVDKRVNINTCSGPYSDSDK